MKTLIKNFLSSPTFMEEEKTRKTGLINVVLTLTMIGSILFLLISGLAWEAGSLIIILSGVMLLISVLLKVFLHRGHVQIVGLTLALIIWTIFSIPMYVYDGIRDSAATGYFLVITIIGLVLSRRILLFFALISSISFFIIFGLENNGILTTSFATPASPVDFSTLFITFNLSAMLVGFLARTISLNENVVREERNKAQKYLDIAGAIIVALDLEQKVTLINKQGCHVLGRSQEEIVGKNWFDNFLPGRIVEPVKKEFNDFMSGEIEKIEYYENPVLTKGGEERMIAWHNTLLRDKGGNVIGALSSGNDVTEKLQSEKLLRESEELHRVMVNTAPYGIQLTDLEGKIVSSNYAHHKIHGCEEGQLVGKYIWDLVADESGRTQTKEHHQKLVREQPPPKSRISKDRTCDGRLIDVQIDWDYFRNSNGELAGIVSIVSDITEQAQIERELEERRLYLEEILRSAPDAILTLDADHRIVEWNPGAEQLFGYVKKEAQGQNVDNLITDPVVVEEAAKYTKAVMAGRVVSPTETVRYRKDGSSVHVIVAGSPILVAGEFVGAVAVYTDISKRKQMEDQLTHLATHDPLTGLPNRTLFQHRMEHALERSARHMDEKVEKWEIAIAVIDLDNFKHINDTLGHATGDLLLKSVAQRLQDGVRKSDTVARMGGDEFTLIFENITGKRDTVILAEKILNAFSQPFDLGERTHKVSASVGLSLYPQDGKDFETLFKCADEAMYQAKLIGNTYRCYSQIQSDENL